ncbi:MAG: tRNA 5-methoxyuridine(34)/uridine 5-oxyacetic acid(34) synthase CmoB [Gammaproteobacteria bacterium]|nr:tRNA 5-methoxyuridine(34)/uridine 5-oxyacetic acid(34) synthase CmoB [Gammaproteobacteria bacterium]MCY4218791.1 tRNA 5-methoxyuridine(34)/uridine 5-oxyacetic acid(34) synthase CmoB [Gammaproteobacteria bacterium]MCY4274298.1 tRNA 5-methoxyuridine(34)/uridine 5-oxyacetic acid(34) synthase CmoB [Gammaproteobacteria bacterium]
MLNPDVLIDKFVGSPFNSITDELLKITERAWKERRHGNMNKWKSLLYSLPSMKADYTNFTSDTVYIGSPTQLTIQQRKATYDILKSLHPWRKGPFNIFGVEVNAEWRSNLKWLRLQGKISALKNRLVLDVGCGNGYYMMRILGEGARFVFGIDPSWLFVIQFQAIMNFTPSLPIAFLPIRLDEFPTTVMRQKGIEFDSVFSMGVLYHRRDPMQHLFELADLLRPGGELILETLITITDELFVLYPQGPYAKMPNIDLIPSKRMLNSWLEESGFGDIQWIDISRTTVDEQRSTEWMTFESLIDFLDPDDWSKTVEGFPAPIRAILTAKKLTK